MQVTFLFDTNHAIAYLNGDERLEPFLAAAEGNALFGISTVSLGELYYGVYASQRVEENLERLVEFVEQLLLFDFDLDSARVFGEIRVEQRRKGNPIPTADAQIAAIARRHELTVLTNDAHLHGIEGVQWENWLA